AGRGHRVPPVGDGAGGAAGALARDGRGDRRLGARPAAAGPDVPARRHPPANPCRREAVMTSRGLARAAPVPAAGLALAVSLALWPAAGEPSTELLLTVGGLGVALYLAAVLGLWPGVLPWA